MKKAIIVLLSVLLVISLTSCNQQDKAAEMVSDYEKFTTGLAICKGAADACRKNMSSESATRTLDENDIHKGSLKYSIEARNGYPFGILNSPTVTSVSGTVTGTRSEVTFENVKVESTYTFNSDYRAVKDGETRNDTLTLSGSYSDKENIDGDEASMTIECNDLKVNGTVYNLSCRIVVGDSETWIFTDAKIDGKDVSLALLNAARVDVSSK